MNYKSNENPGTPGTKLKLFKQNLKILCHPICNWLYLYPNRRKPLPEEGTGKRKLDAVSRISLHSHYTYIYLYTYVYIYGHIYIYTYLLIIENPCSGIGFLIARVVLPCVIVVPLYMIQKRGTGMYSRPGEQASTQ